MRLSPPHEQALLGLLMQGAMHGYELSRHFESPIGLGRIWQLGMSQIYAVLKQLEDAGYIEGERELQTDRPPRKVYHFTPAGEQAFVDWLGEPIEHMRDLRVEFLAKIYFHRKLGLPGLGELIDAQLEVCQLQYAGLVDQAREAEDELDGLVLEFRAGQVKAIIGWLERCRETLVDD